MRKSLLVIAILLVSGLIGANVPWTYRRHQSPDGKYQIVASGSLWARFVGGTGNVKLYDSHGHELATATGVDLSILRDPDDIVWGPREVHSSVRGDHDLRLPLPN